jgi:hypothetical protein
VTLPRRTLPLRSAEPPAPDLTRATQAPSVEPLLSRRDLADVLRTSLRSLDRLAAAGKLPRPDMHLTARQPRWKAATIQRWIDDQSQR